MARWVASLVAHMASRERGGHSESQDWVKEKLEEISPNAVVKVEN